MINKVTVHYSIDKEVVHELNLRNIKNVSGLVTDLLKTYLQLNHQEVDLEKKELEKVVLEKKAELMVLEQKQAIIKKKEQEADDEIKRQIANGELLILD
jgi:hypothetical protein